MTSVEVLAREQAGYQLIATDEGELRAAHQDMIEWAKDRQLACESERVEVEGNLRVAQENGWKTSPFEKRLPLLARRRAFYAKIEAALRAGYVIVPNFQMTIFAIRTDAKAPRGERTFSGWNPEQFVQQAKLLALGEGEYKNPLPALLETHTQVDDGKGGKKTEITRWADEFRALNFPMALAKPMLMERTAAAMTGKVFDEIGVAEDTAFRGGRQGDPIILGRIRNPRPNKPDITFFIGWYFDPTGL